DISACYVCHQALDPFPTRRSSDLSSTHPPWKKSRCPPPGWRSSGGEVDARESLITRERRPGKGKGRVKGSRRFYGQIRAFSPVRSEEHTSELQSRENLVCRLMLEK